MCTLFSMHIIIYKMGLYHTINNVLTFLLPLIKAIGNLPCQSHKNIFVDCTIDLCRNFLTHFLFRFILLFCFCLIYPHFY